MVTKNLGHDGGLCACHCKIQSEAWSGSPLAYDPFKNMPWDELKSMGQENPTMQEMVSLAIALSYAESTPLR